MDPVEAIFERHGIRDPWTELPATGIANRIYATRDVVLRVAVATDEGRSDARAESVAAPIAYAAGITTPRMLAFDDSLDLVDRPYSLWERVHGVTVGRAFPDALPLPDLWRAVGRELGRLHARVHDVPDPHGWLDRPEHGQPRAKLRELVAARRIDRAHAEALDARLAADEPALAHATRCFLHDDVHPDNVMATADGAFLAVIDWGDAGFGDPALDFEWLPELAVGFALDGYAELMPVDPTFTARVRWARISNMLDELPHAM